MWSLDSKQWFYFRTMQEGGFTFHLLFFFFFFCNLKSSCKIYVWLVYVEYTHKSISLNNHFEPPKSAKRMENTCKNKYFMIWYNNYSLNQLCKVHGVWNVSVFLFHSRKLCDFFSSFTWCHFPFYKCNPILH